jgi:hypothetical protein
VQIVGPDGSSKLAYGFVSGVFGCAATGNNDEVRCSWLVFLWPRNPALRPGMLVQGGRRSDAARNTRETEGRMARGGKGRRERGPAVSSVCWKGLEGLDWHGSRACGFLVHQGGCKMMAS